MTPEEIRAAIDCATEETLFAPGPCALCGRDPAVGFASVGDEWYCHGDLDPEPTCYMRASWAPKAAA